MLAASMAFCWLFPGFLIKKFEARPAAARPPLRGWPGRGFSQASPNSDVDVMDSSSEKSQAYDLTTIEVSENVHNMSKNSLSEISTKSMSNDTVYSTVRSS